MRAISGISLVTADVSSFQRNVSPDSLTTVGPFPETAIPVTQQAGSVFFASSLHAQKKASYQEQATNLS